MDRKVRKLARDAATHVVEDWKEFPERHRRYTLDEEVISAVMSLTRRIAFTPQGAASLRKYAEWLAKNIRA